MIQTHPVVLVHGGKTYVLYVVFSDSWGKPEATIVQITQIGALESPKKP